MSVDFDAIEKVLAKMTQGHLYILRHDEDDGEFDYHILGSGDVIAVFSERGSPRAKRDAEGFVKLMDAAPALIARIRELEADHDRWRLVAENKCKARMEEERLKFEALAELDEANARIRELEAALGEALAMIGDWMPSGDVVSEVCARLSEALAGKGGAP